MRLLCSLVTLVLVAQVAGAAAQSSRPEQDGASAALDDDEQLVLEAGLTSDGPALLRFFRNRARTEVDVARLDDLMRRFVAASLEERREVTAELIGLGPLATPALRRLANAFEDAEISVRARRCLAWLHGPKSASLIAAAARLLAQRKPAGAPEALLAYLPCADDDESSREVSAALNAVSVSAGRVDPVVLRALGDRLAVCRAAAVVALCQAGPPEQRPAVRKALADPNPVVRMRAAVALTRAKDLAGVPVLIDLLTVLPADKRREAEEVLQELAGDWTPLSTLLGEDEIARRIRRDAWAAWWSNTDGPALVAMLRKRTLAPAEEDRVRALIRKLGHVSFEVREKASSELAAQGSRILPLLRAALKEADLEISRRAQQCLQRIEQDPALRLPAAAIRLLALRKPAGAVEALLAYVPFAEDEALVGEIRTTLTALAERDNKPDAALVEALGNPNAAVRALAGEALVRGLPPETSAVRKLLKDSEPSVRVRIALALAPQDRQMIPLLVDIMPALPADQLGQVQEFLNGLAGDKAPAPPVANDQAARKKYRDEWAAWWKEHGSRIDLARLDSSQQLLGFRLVVSGNNKGRVVELGRDGKPRWSIEDINFPVDAWVLPGNRVLIAEYSGHRVTERDLKGKVLWEKNGLNGNPVNVQRLPNGNTFIATDAMLLEVDRRGKEVFALNSLGPLTAACKARNGEIVCLTQNGQCVRLSPGGKQLKSFPSNRDAGWTSGIDVLANGRILITQPNRNKVAEYDASGKLILEIDAPAVTTATGLPNGHVLAASSSTGRVFELDRRGKVVWEHQGHANAFRARRR
jgi:HEAT repeat protein